jgi:hypothetical protein
MQVTISIKKDNGEVLEFMKELNKLDEKDIIASVEQEVFSIKEELLPKISEKLIEEHQSLFEGEKNQEKERE